MTTNINEQEHSQIRDAFTRLAAQSTAALSMLDMMVHDGDLRSPRKFQADYAVGDFLIWDRTLHPFE